MSNKRYRLNGDCEFISHGKPIVIPEGTEIIIEEIKEEPQSNDSFQWTDELVKEYAAWDKTRISTSVDPIYLFKGYHTPKPQAENKPDRDWEIVYQTQDYKANSFIVSVKRLSDNSIWAVGEYAGTKHLSRDRIKGFYVKDDEMYVITDNDSFNFCWLSKLPPQPRKEEPERIEVTEMVNWGGGSKGIMDKGKEVKSWVTGQYLFTVEHGLIPSDKFPLIKQAIEDAINS